MACRAQFGANVFYKNDLSAENWETVLHGDDGYLKSGYGASLDYWFRLKKYRVEFLPEVYYALSEHETLFNSSIGGAVPATVRAEYIGFNFNLNVYPLNFEGDCMCPTFGKQGPTLEKGWYVQISPGASHLSGEANTIETKAETSGMIYHISAGTGLDLGLSKYLTLTPWLRYTYYLPSDWNDLSIHLPPEERSNEAINSNHQSLLFGLRVGYRWDYRRRYR